MKPLSFLFVFILLTATWSCDTVESADPAESAEQPASDEQSREYYQLKIYTFNTDEQAQTTDAFLEEAFLPGLAKLEVGPVGVFKSRADTVIKTFVLIPLTSLDRLADLEERLAEDEAYLAAGRDYIDAPHDQPPYERYESILLRAFEDMPTMQTPELDGPRSERVYELRSYESSTEAIYKNKVDMFNAGGEITLFDQLGFNAVFYGEVLSGPNMPNLMYMTTFSDMESRDAHWKAFVDAPEWKEMSSLPKYQNNVSHADIMLLYPTEYSDY